MQYFARNRGSLIGVGDVDQVFNGTVIKELAELADLPANTDLARFAKSIRDAAHLFIESKPVLMPPHCEQKLNGSTR
jgi:hypothetical protein